MFKKTKQNKKTLRTEYKEIKNLYILMELSKNDLKQQSKISQ